MSERHRWTLEPYQRGSRWPRVRLDANMPLVRAPIEVMPVFEHEAEMARAASEHARERQELIGALESRPATGTEAHGA
jgi:hypothetical protein